MKVLSALAIGTFTAISTYIILEKFETKKIKTYRDQETTNLFKIYSQDIENINIISDLAKLHYTFPHPIHGTGFILAKVPVSLFDLEDPEGNSLNFSQYEYKCSLCSSFEDINSEYESESKFVYGRKFNSVLAYNSDNDFNEIFYCECLKCVALQNAIDKSSSLLLFDLKMIIKSYSIENYAKYKNNKFPLILKPKIFQKEELRMYWNLKHENLSLSKESRGYFRQIEKQANKWLDKSGITFGKDREFAIVQEYKNPPNKWFNKSGTFCKDREFTIVQDYDDNYEFVTIKLHYCCPYWTVDLAKKHLISFINEKMNLLNKICSQTGKGYDTGYSGYLGTIETLSLNSLMFLPIFQRAFLELKNASRNNNDNIFPILNCIKLSVGQIWVILSFDYDMWTRIPEYMKMNVNVKNIKVELISDNLFGQNN